MTKPSERIRTAANAQLTGHYHLERLDQSSRTAVSAAVMVAEVLTYLDEQAELEQLRVHVRNALAMLGPYPGASRRVNEALATAGLKTRVSDGQPLGECATNIVAEAKQEGLF